MERSIVSDKPWLEKKAWRQNRILSDAKSAFILTWIFALIWNALIILAFRAPDLLEKIKSEPVFYVFALFPFIGAYVFWLAIRQTQEWLNLGRTPLVMDPFPGSIGGQLGGKIETNLRYDQSSQASVSVECVFSRMTGSGKHSRRSETIVWQNSGQCHLGQSHSGMHFQFRFDVPSNLPATDHRPKTSNYHFWRLSVEIKKKRKKDIFRSYRIPVFATSEQAEFIAQGTEDHEATKTAAQSGVDSVARIQHTHKGLEISYPAFKRPLSGIALFLGGVLFVTVGAYILNTGAPLIFSLFIAIGAFVALGGLYSLGKSLHLVVSGGGMSIQRALFGFTLYTRKIARETLRSFEVVKDGSAQYNGKTVVYYKVEVIEKDDNRHIVAERLTGRPEAELILSKLEDAVS